MKKRSDEMCPFSNLAFLRSTTVDKETKQKNEHFSTRSMI